MHCPRGSASQVDVSGEMEGRWSLPCHAFPGRAWEGGSDLFGWRRLPAEFLEVLLDHLLGRLRQALDFDCLGRFLDGLPDVPGHLDARCLFERRSGGGTAVGLAAFRVEESTDALLLTRLGDRVLVLGPPAGRALGVAARVVLIAALLAISFTLALLAAFFLHLLQVLQMLLDVVEILQLVVDLAELL